MAQQLDRAELVKLLEGLGAEKDEDVLATARAVHEKISAAEASWDQLLAAGGGTDSGTSSRAGGSGDESAAAPVLSGAVPGEEEAAALISRMLERDDISENLRAELESYREDIAENEFDEGDRKYVQALYERLTQK